MRVPFLWWCFWISLAPKLIAQTTAQSTYLFIQHLIQTNKNREALFLLNQTNEIIQADTLNYLRGMNYYFLKRTDSAALCFAAVSANSPFLVKSRCFESINLAYSKQYSAANEAFDKLSPDSVIAYQPLLTTIKAGNYLLMRNYKRFDSLAVFLNNTDYRLIKEQERLLALNKLAKQQKHKSPLLAGCLSAVIPGAGKFYAGKKGAAMSALAACTVLGLSTAEAYYRTKSFKSPQFITLGTIFTFFYVGNIFGSVYSIKQQIKSTNGKINNEILATIHVPIVRFFK